MATSSGSTWCCRAACILRNPNTSALHTVTPPPSIACNVSAQKVGLLSFVHVQQQAPFNLSGCIHALLTLHACGPQQDTQPRKHIPRKTECCNQGIGIGAHYAACAVNTPKLTSICTATVTTQVAAESIPLLSLETCGCSHSFMQVCS